MNKRKYSLNDSFFDKWSPEMAYILGFWFADGYMRHEKSYRIVFSSKDYNLLEKIKECLKSDYKIYKRKNGTEYQLVIYSKKMYKRLLSLGGERCKSKKIAFPEIPNPFLKDFIRGYFDGDGSVFFTKYTASKNRKIYKELRSNFTSGSQKFLEELQEILIEKFHLTRKKIIPCKNSCSKKLGYGTKDTLKLLKLMYYPNCSIKLDRKFNFLKK